MTLALIRHGQTDWNAAGLFQGSTDIPLNDVGRGQARETARLLADGGVEWANIVSSPLRRARETAEIIASELGLDLGSAYDEWIERSYGIYEGKPDAPELKTHPSVEKMTSVIARGRAGLTRVSAECQQPTLLVAHGTIIRYTLNDIAGALPAEPTIPRILNGALSTIDRDESGMWRITALNLNPSLTTI
ncbi:MAG TPA: histidine phosphatase family protein [Microbacteriaceae bacterium]|nr:histidine phosphatase family protein [Microbacteriaceae bacterium]